MNKFVLVAATLLSTTQAHAFIDLGFVDIPGQSVGYEARIREFNDPAQAVDYWLVTAGPICCGSFAHDFGPPTGVEYLTLASVLGLAEFTPATVGPLVPPGVPEPSTWAMMLLGFIGLAWYFRQKRQVIRAQ